MKTRIGRTAIAIASGAVVIGSLAGCATDQSAEADTAPSAECDVVTAVDVTGSATSGNSKQYQSAFISGISAEVVGKDIDSLDVSKVAGSSLTSGGFNAALDTIRSDAS